MRSRSRPLVVVSTAFGTTECSIDPVRVAEELDGIADVAVLSTGDVSRVVDELLPDKLQVFGGAARSYPVDIGRDADIRRSPLRFPGAAPERAVEQVVSDAVAQAYAAGALRTPLPTEATARGTVLGITAGRALVSLESGGMASIWHELTWPEVPLEWVVHTGLEVTGSVDAASGRFMVRAPEITAEVIAAAYPHHAVVPALVEQVSDAGATLVLHPDVRVVVHRTDVSVNERDKLSFLLSEGEVVAARVLHLQAGVLHLQLLDVEDDETVLPAISLLPGGEPWLREDRPLPSHVAEQDEPEGEPAMSAPTSADVVDAVDTAVIGADAETADAEDAETEPADTEPTDTELAAAPADGIPRPGSSEYRTALQDTQLALVAARSRVAALETRLKEVGADDSAHARLEGEARLQRRITQQVKVELADAHQEVVALKEQLSRARRELRARARPDVETPARASRDERRSRWPSTESWLRHEIVLAWVDRVAAADKARWPLPDSYRIGDRFAASVAELDDALFEKAMKATVDVLTGRAREISGRELHPLRQGEAGNAPAYVRHSDGARCFRVYVEQKVPAARRLHFWQLPDGEVELERVVSHDVVEP
jgi:hypothetical protein